MNIAIRYFTRSGNTKKLADAISNQIGVEAFSLDAKIEEKVDVLFLGSSVYAANPNPAVEKYLFDNKENIGIVVCFGTSAILPSTYKHIKKFADKNGLNVCDEFFHCKGSFGALHKDRPNENDLVEVAAFAKKIVESLNKD